jgi:hypothetical protein
MKLGLVVGMLVLAGCSAHGVGFSDGTSGSDPVGGGGTQVGTGSGDGNSTFALYAHTDTTLYALDPENLTKPMQLLGDFDCVGYKQAASSMTDLAVGKDGTLFGISTVAVYPLAVQNGVVHCTAIWTLPANEKFYGLTMAPENTVDANETLIAANGLGQLYRIDRDTGNATQVGTLGTDPKSGLPWALSGDIVFLANGGNPIGFATVRTCPNNTCTSVDTVIQVDVSKIKPGTQSVLLSVRGQAKSPSTTFGSMFGIVAYKDKVVGFSTKGDIVSISNVDGSATLISSNPTLRFTGAGVSTLAPVIAPPN